jgi:hypothetical protein
MKNIIKGVIILLTICLIGFSNLFIDLGYEKETDIFYIDISHPLLYFILFVSLSIAIMIGLDLLKSIEKDEEKVNHFKNIQ